MTSLFGVLLLVTASLCSALIEVRGEEPGGGRASASSSSKGARTLDKLSGGEYIRGLGGRRHLDKISGGELLRSADDAEVLRELMLPYALRSSSTHGSEPRRGLDKIGGGEYIRTAGAFPPGASPAKRQAAFDSLSGLTFGGDQGGLHKRGYGHGEFDEIDHAGWPGFYKRNFDEIDRTGFEGFYKRSAREE
ncbi:uncharacterized protein LOC119445961 [Dermacentor silvarum]|uniref:uncharacterized protein LOC119445961 n=1 Tax=Dermacentor silvarum TaxID=543639 RepID=UPI0018974645|nr:uncharacterized protein LOC119445961 [Dermacentor silvarum]